MSELIIGLVKDVSDHGGCSGLVSLLLLGNVVLGYGAWKLWNDEKLMRKEHFDDLRKIAEAFIEERERRD